MSSIIITRFTVPVLANPRTTDPEAIRAFDLVSKAIGSWSKHPLLDGVLIQNVPLPTDQNFQIEHKLGRPWRGWYETNRIVSNSMANTVREGTSNLDRRYYLELRATNSLVVDLWVF